MLLAYYCCRSHKKATIYYDCGPYKLKATLPSGQGNGMSETLSLRMMSFDLIGGLNIYFNFLKALGQHMEMQRWMTCKQKQMCLPRLHLRLCWQAKSVIVL